MPTHPPGKEADAHETGFTLIEVLAALAILALTLAVLFPVISDGAGRAAHAEKQAKALLQAQSLLAAVGSQIALQQGHTSGHFDDGSRWQLTIEAHGDSAERRAWPAAAYMVSVEVAWVHGSQERSLALTTLRLGAKESMR